MGKCPQLLTLLLTLPLLTAHYLATLKSYSPPPILNNYSYNVFPKSLCMQLERRPFSDVPSNSQWLCKFGVTSSSKHRHTKQPCNLTMKCQCILWELSRTNCGTWKRTERIRLPDLGWMDILYNKLRENSTEIDKDHLSVVLKTRNLRKIELTDCVFAKSMTKWTLVTLAELSLIIIAFVYQLKYSDDEEILRKVIRKTGEIFSSDWLIAKRCLPGHYPPADIILPGTIHQQIS